MFKNMPNIYVGSKASKRAASLKIDPSPSPTPPGVLDLGDAVVTVPDGWEVYADELVQDARRLVRLRDPATDVRVHGVFTRWEAVVGREVAQHCSPESYAEGKLVVRTDSTAWATQVKLLAPNVVRRLNEELGDGTVTVIDVLGPTGPSWKRGPRSVRDGRGPRDTYG